MFKAACLVAAIACVASPAPVRSQEAPGPMRKFAFSYGPGRPRIGVMLDIRPDADRDRIGAGISEVTPEGPADQAGLKAGDIITRFNGVALGGSAAEDEDESGPAHKLIELAGKLEAGDTVAVEYQRGGASHSASLVARDLGRVGMGREFRMELPDMEHWGHEEGMPGMRMFRGDGPGDFEVFLGRSGGLHLADLNPDLGEYFGTKQGVLVLETPSDSGTTLKAGDVILTIDGRAPASEAHARRILRSYDTGETARLEILRKQKKLTVTWKGPAHSGEMHWNNAEPRVRSKVKVERS
jgi:S1-C subfamily serine protease